MVESPAIIYTKKHQIDMISKRLVRQLVVTAVLLTLMTARPSYKNENMEERVSRQISVRETDSNTSEKVIASNLSRN